MSAKLFNPSLLPLKEWAVELEIQTELETKNKAKNPCKPKKKQKNMHGLMFLPCMDQMLGEEQNDSVHGKYSWGRQTLKLF